MALQVTKLTPAERLLIQRRREGITQQQAAEKWDVPTYVYCAWETEAEYTGNVEVPVVSIGPLAAHEKCLLLRKRNGYTLAKLEALSEINRQWITHCERGRADATKLIEFWEKHAA